MTISSKQRLLQGFPTLFMRGAVIIMLLIVSCTAINDNFPNLTNGNTTLTFSVSVPTGTKTRSADDRASSKDDAHISSVHVLAFQDAKDGNKYKLADWSQAYSSSINNDGKSGVVFTTTFTRLEENKEYRFVLLANTTLKELGDLLIGTEQETLLKQLTITMEGKWPMGSDARDIPMWGETDKDVKVENDNKVEGVKLVRMLAKINVNISAKEPDGEKAATEYFKLKSVHLYNAHNTGHLVPASGNMKNGSLSVVEKPTLVNGSKVNEQPIVYEGDIVSETSLTNTIYTFEAQNIVEEKPVEDKDMTSLVIGGDYNKEGKTTYYRVNFNETVDGKKVDINLLRNHSYTINIVKIIGSGYDSPEEAFNTKPINMEAEIVEWNEGEVGEIHESGDYRLSISPSSELTFYGEVQSIKTININTNAPDGWKVLKITDTLDGVESNVNWLSVDKKLNEYIGSDGSKIPLRVTAEPNTGDDRVAYIHIKFSRTIVTITATQYAAGKTILEVTSDGNKVDELVFTSMNDTYAQVIDIEWNPSDISLKINEGSSDINWALDIPESAETGRYMLNIKPTPFTSAEKNQIIERTSTLNFEVTNSINTTKKSITARHINYTVIPSGLTEYYIADGNLHSFNMKSNSNWKIKSIEEDVTTGSGKLLNLEANGNLKVDEEFVENQQGTPISFTTADNPNTFGTVTVTVVSTDTPKKFADKEIIIKFGLAGYVTPHNGWAGSNIYWDGEKMTFDDVGVKTNEHYQGLYFKWGSLWGISPMGAWNESKSDVILYSPDGQNKKASAYNIGNKNLGTWENIPNATGSSTYDRNYAYLYTLPLKEGEKDYKSGVGDICKYLTKMGWAPAGKKWRMPTSNEFGTVHNAGEYSSAPGTNDPTAVDGTAKFGFGYIKNAENIFFPSSGFRRDGSGDLAAVGLGGYYWSSSTISTSAAYCLDFYNHNVYPGYTSNVGASFIVRCVAE